jgi:hypothetical protein
MRCTNECTYGKESGARKLAGVLALAANENYA